MTLAPLPNHNPAAVSTKQQRPRVQRGAGVARTTDFARRLWREWRRLALPAAAEQRVVIAVSGGADSTTLLLAFHELLAAHKLDLTVLVAHLDHGLRGADGEADARWVAELAGKLGCACALDRIDIKARAAQARDNVEQAARGARYEFLGRAARDFGASLILTAHTQDDQAETVLLRLLRGSGADGLGGMRPVRDLNFDGLAPRVQLARPLLAWARRAETTAYCRARGVEFRVDATNADENFSRVRARRQLIPLLETFNPRAVEAVARSADLLRDDALALEAFATQLLETAAMEPGTTDLQIVCRRLSVKTLLAAWPALRRRALRQWLAAAKGDLRRIELAHVLAIEKLLDGTQSNRTAELPGGYFVRRERGEIQLLFKKVDKDGV